MPRRAVAGLFCTFQIPGNFVNRAGESGHCSAAQAQEAAFFRCNRARIAGQNLAAEWGDVGADMVGEKRPVAVVDDIDANEPPRQALLPWPRFGFAGGSLAEQAFDDFEARVVVGRDFPSGPDGLRRAPSARGC